MVIIEIPKYPFVAAGEKFNPYLGATPAISYIAIYFGPISHELISLVFWNFVWWYDIEVSQKIRVIDKWFSDNIWTLLYIFSSNYKISFINVDRILKKKKKNA